MEGFSEIPPAPPGWSAQGELHHGKCGIGVEGVFQGHGDLGTPIQDMGETLFTTFAKGASIFAAFDDVMRRVGAVTAASVEKPIMPRDCIPAATWAAVKAVEAPRLFARSPNADSFSA